MADLGKKKLGSNYNRLLQLSESMAVADGTGSAYALRLSGSSNVGIGMDPQPNIDLSVAGTISASVISASTGVFGANTVYIGDTFMGETNQRFTISSGSSNMASFEGAGYLVLSASGLANSTEGGLPLFSLKDDKLNALQIEKYRIKILETSLNTGWSIGVYPSGSNSNTGDFVIHDNFVALPSSQPVFFISSSANNNIGIGTFGNLINKLSVAGSSLIEGNITASGDISASGTIIANDFQSATGGSGIDFNDNLDVSGNITTAGNITANGNMTASGDISASGNFETSHTGSFGLLDVDKIDSDIYFQTRSFMISQSGDLGAGGKPTAETAFWKNGYEYLTFDGVIGNDPLKLTVNISNNNLDFKVNSMRNDKLIFTDASSDSLYLASGSNGGVAIGTFNTSSAKLTVDGNISSSGTIIVDSINVNGGLLNDVQIGSTTPATYLRVDDIELNGGEISSHAHSLHINSQEEVHVRKKLAVHDGISGSGEIIVNNNIKSLSGSLIGNSIYVNDGLLNNVIIGGTTPAQYLRVDDIELNGKRIYSYEGLEFNVGSGKKIEFKDNIAINGNVSGSVNSTGSFGMLDVESKISSDIYFQTRSFMISQSGDLGAGGKPTAETAFWKNDYEYLTFDGVIGNDPLKLTVNISNNNLDFKVNSMRNDRLIFTDASSDSLYLASGSNGGVAIGTFNTSSAKLTVDGTISSSANIYIPDGHITASGASFKNLPTSDAGLATGSIWVSGSGGGAASGSGYLMIAGIHG